MRYSPKDSHPQMGQKYASCIGPFMDSSKYLEVGTYGLIGASNRMASLGMKKNRASISGLLVL